MSVYKLPPIVNTGVLLATIAQLTTDLEAERALADRNAALAAGYKKALENIGLWVTEGLKK